MGFLGNFFKTLLDVKSPSTPAATGPVRPHSQSPAPKTPPPRCPATRSRKSRQTASLVVQDTNGSKRTLATQVGKGGEGEVWATSDDANVLVKIYHHPTTAQHDKIKALKSCIKLYSADSFGWPKAEILDTDGKWIGYAMRRRTGHQLQTLCQPQLLRERMPNWDRRQLITTAKSFVSLVAEAHAAGVVMGDVNTANYLVDPANGQVSAIDCDSYQYSSNGTFFACPVGIPMLMAPELLDCDMETTRRSVESDYFAAAIMLYRIFMVGAHPYSRVMGDTPIENLRSGKTPVGIGNGCQFPRGRWYDIWSHLPFRMKKLFVQAFVDGHSAPSSRPTLKDWQQALSVYRNDMDKGWMETAIIPDGPKSRQYRGTRQVQSASTPANAGAHHRKT